MKSNYGWDGSPGNGNNESGFEGLPGGRVFGNQSQISTLAGLYGIWWTTPPPVNNGVNPMYITLSNNGNSLGDGFENDHLVGYSARCIKD